MILDQKEGGYTGRVFPGTITSESAGGQLTFEFTSNSSHVESGWLATVSCVGVPSAPTALMATPISYEQINLAWGVPANDGGLATLAYDIEVSTDGTDFVNVNNEPVAPLEDGDVVMRAGEVMACGRIFLDPGGDRDYQNNQDITMTFVPAFAGSKVSVEFTSFLTEPRFDNLSIYDGAADAQRIDKYSGSTLPPVITSTSLDGKLTFRFYI